MRAVLRSTTGTEVLVDAVVLVDAGTGCGVVGTERGAPAGSVAEVTGEAGVIVGVEVSGGAPAAVTRGPVTGAVGGGVVAGVVGCVTTAPDGSTPGFA